MYSRRNIKASFVDAVLGMATGIVHCHVSACAALVFLTRIDPLLKRQFVKGDDISVNYCITQIIFKSFTSENPILSRLYAHIMSRCTCTACNQYVMLLHSSFRKFCRTRSFPLLLCTISVLKFRGTT